MAYTFGRPVVATDVGAMADSVRDGQTGLLVPPDPASVAQAMITMLDPATADEMGAAAARHAQSARVMVPGGRPRRGGIPGPPCRVERLADVARFTANRSRPA
jgi:hypothetical protein